MVVTPHGIAYAVDIVTFQFGDLIAKVCECLLRKGPLSKIDIARYTELSAVKVKNSLSVLIQHNCAQAFIFEEPGNYENGPKLTSLYMVLFDSILNRPRFSKFSEIVMRELGEQCSGIFEMLIEDGRLNMRELLDRARSRDPSVVLDTVRDTLSKLVNAHFVERIPASEPVISAPTEEETATKKRGSKSSKVIKESETFEQRVLEAAMPIEAKRFSFIAESEPGLSRESKDTSSFSITLGTKRQLDSVESKEESGPSDLEAITWRANFQEFVHRLRHKACIENVRARLDDGSAIVFGAMLEAARPEEKRIKAEKSVPLSVNSIYEEVIKSETGCNMTLERVESSLDQLASTSPPFVIDSDGSYRIDFKSIIEAAQNEEVESVVLKRYGREAYRMFRLLSKAGRLLETDKIADTTFVEKKDAPKILYKLWKDEYLNMEKLVVTGARQSTFLLWKVNKHTLLEHFLDEMFHASLNLRHRLAYELEQNKEVLGLPADKFVGQLKDKYNRMRNARMLLECARINLDDAIMLFNDF